MASINRYLKMSASELNAEEKHELLTFCVIYVREISLYSARSVLRWVFVPCMSAVNILNFLKAVFCIVNEHI